MSNSEQYSEIDVKEISYLRIILKRPKMYTPTGSLGELLLFLYGYSLGLMTGDADARKEVHAFFDWIDNVALKGQVNSQEDAINRPSLLIKQFGSEDAFLFAADQMLEEWAIENAK